MYLTVTLLIVNIFFPGIGTIIGSYGINNPDYQSSFFCHGICELFLMLFIILVYFYQLLLVEKALMNFRFF